GGGHLQGGVAHAEADLEGARRAAAEHLVEIAQAVGQLQAELRPALVQAALLALGHAPGAHDETLDAAQRAFGGAFARRLDNVAHGILLEPVQNLCRMRESMPWERPWPRSCYGALSVRGQGR